MKIFGVRIDNIRKGEALQKVSDFLQSNKQNKIFTPNPEMLVDASRDSYFKEVLNSGDLNVCDGKGIQIASRILRSSDIKSERSEVRDLSEDINDKIQNPNVIQSAVSSKDPSSSTSAEAPVSSLGIIEKIPGVDLMLDICELAEKENKSIYLLGSGSDEVVKKTADVLQEKLPLLNIVGYNSGPKLQVIPTGHPPSGISYKLQVDKDKNEDTIYDIIIKAPDILFVAFGHGKQEKWIYENLVDLPSVKIAMGVGGSFDFISGKTKRAPVWMRKVGLEWLYRLVREPKRLFRIWKAVVVFLFYSFRNHTK